jgi:hypothetical protein
MNDQVLKWCVDILLLVIFFISAITGIIKYAVLVHLPAIVDAPLPLAMISDIHDRAGILLVVLVAVHLFLNRRWIAAMTRKMLNGETDPAHVQDQGEREP